MSEEKDKTRKLKGRPLTATLEQANAIARYLRAGNYLHPSLAMAGVAPSSFYRWMERGELAYNDHEGDLDAIEDEHDELLARFWETVTRAEAEAEVRAVTLVMRAADHHALPRSMEKDGIECDVQAADWRAAMAFLKHRHPDRWGLRKAEVSGEGGAPIKVEMSMPSNGRERDPDE